MFAKIFSILYIFGAVAYLVPISQSYVYRIDTANNDIEANNFEFDHVESRKFYPTEEELIGVWAASQNASQIGVWVFESQGVGGCCGGLWELRSPFFNTTETFELLIKFNSNVAFEVNAYSRDGVKNVIQPTQRIIVPPNNSTVINWRTELFRISQGTRFIRLASRLEVMKRGYLLLEKLILAVNEPIPVGDLL